MVLLYHVGSLVQRARVHQLSDESRSFILEPVKIHWQFSFTTKQMRPFGFISSMISKKTLAVQIQPAPAILHRQVAGCISD